MHCAVFISKSDIQSSPWQVIHITVNDKDDRNLLGIRDWTCEPPEGYRWVTWIYTCVNRRVTLSLTVLVALRVKVVIDRSSLILSGDLNIMCIQNFKPTTFSIATQIVFTIQEWVNETCGYLNCKTYPYTCMQDRKTRTCCYDN